MISQGIERIDGAHCKTLGQERRGECGGLNETIPHELRCLNPWSSVGGTVWVGLGGLALMEE